MLEVSIHETLISQNSERSIKRVRKRMEKALLRHPNAVLFFYVTPKTRKQKTIRMYLEYANERFCQQEFSSRSWEDALEQCADHAIRFLRHEFKLSHTSIPGTR